MSGFLCATNENPVRRARPFPRLRSCRTTRAPACLALSAVMSVLPSSTTMTKFTYPSVLFATSPIERSSMYAGITATTFGWGMLRLRSCGNCSPHTPCFGLSSYGARQPSTLLYAVWPNVFLLTVLAICGPSVWVGDSRHPQAGQL